MPNRVYSVPENLREAIKIKRAQTDTTNAAVIEAAVTEKLPVILQGLAGLGLTGRMRRTSRHPAGKSATTRLVP